MGYFYSYKQWQDISDHIEGAMKKLHRRKNIQTHGDYRTKHQTLKVYNAMQLTINTGEPHQIQLASPSTASRVAHGENTCPDRMKGEV